jgi:hypothetical protein
MSGLEDLFKMNKTKEFSRAVRATAILLVAVQMSWAAVTGSISGTLKDPTGAVIPGVTVTVTNTAQGVKTTSVSDAKGVYVFPSLAVGTYDLKVEASGFKPTSRDKLVVDVDSAQEVNLTLELQERVEEVTVNESTAHVETESTQVGEVVTNRQMTAIALNGRSYTDLLALQPGITPMSTQQPDSVVMAGATVAISPSGTLNPGNQSIAGQREDANGFLVNGADVKEMQNGGTLIIPNIDSIEEFRVLTNNFDAQYGNYSGGIVNAVTKTGTNAFHGGAFEFLRNTNLDARNFFAPEREAFHENQFGGTTGGAIKKNSVFFFGDYQGTRLSHAHDTGLIAVPSLADRTGNFSDQASSLTGAVSGPYLANLLGGRLGYGVTAGEQYYFPGCTTAAQCVFPNAVIPMRAWSAPAQHLLQYIPTPNLGPSTFSDDAEKEGVHDDKGSIRIDANTERIGLLTAYYFIDDFTDNDPYPTGQGGASVPGFNALNNGRGQLITLGHTKTFGGTTVNEVRLSFMRSANVVGQPKGGVGPSLASQGFQTGVGTPGIVPLRPDLEGVENIVFNSFVMGVPITNLAQWNNTFGLSDNFSKVLGSHNMKFGLSGSYEQVNVNPNPTANGSFLFAGTETGLDFADFLIGVDSNYNQAQSGAYYERHKYWSGFAQDSWRLRPNLTLNYGVRYERMNYWYEKYNQFPTFKLGQQSQVYPQAPLGVVYPTDTGVPRTIVPGANKFAPRIGIAWSPGNSDGWLGKIVGGPGKTSVRAGYGMFYSVIQGQVLAFNLPQPPYGLSYTSPGPSLFNEPFRTASDGSFTGNPYPFKIPPLNTTKSNPDPSQSFDGFIPIQGATGPNPNNVFPYNEQYFLSIERQLTTNTVLNVSYVGSQSHHQLLTYSVNPGNPALCLSLSTPDSVAPGSATCGPFGESSQYISASGQVFNGTRGPFGGALGNDDFEGTVGNASYNSLQASLRHTGKDLTLQLAYTYSKSIDQASALGDTADPFNFKQTRALSAWDLTHNFVASYDYRIPFDRLTPKWHYLTQGWEIAGITRASSGFPITLKSNDDNSLQGSIPNGVNNYSLDIGNYTGAPLQLNGNPRDGLPYFNPAAFEHADLGTLGNASRRSFHGPGELNFDISLLRSFRITESKALQLRVESFNTFNHARFFGPAAVQGNIDSPLFGQVVKAADPRIMQVALKFTF